MTIEIKNRWTGAVLYALAFAFLILAVCVAGYFGMGWFEVVANGGRW